MFETENISSRVNGRAFFVRLCSFFLVIVFLFAQTLSSAHSHDHEHEDERPLNQSCEVCILAVNDEGDFDSVADLEPETKDMSFFWVQIDRLALPEGEHAPSVDYTESSIDPPSGPEARPDAARAPPLNI